MQVILYRIGHFHDKFFVKIHTFMTHFLHFSCMHKRVLVIKARGFKQAISWTFVAHQQNFFFACLPAYLVVLGESFSESLSKKLHVFLEAVTFE